ncbi:MAG: hypothetical protein IRY94_21315, partial [Rhodospirillaceae bacterium]|nr:hypothetical protein [Rhodospirillaceae bacterium]
MRKLCYIGPLVLAAGTLSGCTAALTAASVAVGVVQIAQVAAGGSSGGAAGAKQQPSLFSWLSRFTAPKKQLAQLDRTPSDLCLSRIPQPPGEAAKMSLAVAAAPAKSASRSTSAPAPGSGIVSTKYVVPDKERPASRCEVRLICLPNATHPAPMWVCPNGEVSPEAPAAGQTATTLGSGNPTAWAWSATEPLVAAPRTTTAIATASSVSGTKGTGVAAADGAMPAAAATAPSGT